VHRSVSVGSGIAALAALPYVDVLSIGQFLFCSINHIFFVPLTIFERFFVYQPYLTVVDLLRQWRRRRCRQRNDDGRDRFRSLTSGEYSTPHSKKVALLTEKTGTGVFFGSMNEINGIGLLYEREIRYWDSSPDFSEITVETADSVKYGSARRTR